MNVQTLRVSTGDRIAVNVFYPPKEDFAISVLSATVNFVSKRPVAGPALMLDAPEMNAHLQSRFGSQVCGGMYMHDCHGKHYARTKFCSLQCAILDDHVS